MRARRIEIGGAARAAARAARPMRAGAAPQLVIPVTPPFTTSGATGKSVGGEDGSSDMRPCTTQSRSPEAAGPEFAVVVQRKQRAARANGAGVLQTANHRPGAPCLKPLPAIAIFLPAKR
jgi:hypothetical protein